VEELKSDGQRLADKIRELWAASAAVGHLSQNYYPVAVQNKPFGEELEKGRAQQLKKAPPAASIREYKELLQALWNLEHPGESAVPDVQDDVDDDIVDVGGATQVHGVKNRQCPLTQKFVEDLSEPVIDSMGFVYEKTNILAYLKKNGGRDQTARCPQAATAHNVSPNDLRNARHNVRLYKRDLGRQQTQHAQQGVHSLV